MRIRDYHDNDMNQVLQLHDEFELTYFPELRPQDAMIGNLNLKEKYSYYLQQPGKFWVMEDQGMIVGFIGVQPQPDERLELIQLRVRKSHQRLGIGTHLIKKVEEHALAIGKTQIYLHTAKRLLNARNLYEKSGYTLEESIESAVFTLMTYKKSLSR